MAVSERTKLDPELSKLNGLIVNIRSSGAKVDGLLQPGEASVGGYPAETVSQVAECLEHIRASVVEAIAIVGPPHG